MQKKLFKTEKKGQSIVETALILPIIILILVGIIDFGLLFNNQLVITNASREGARYAAIGYSDAEIVSVVSSVTNTLDQTSLTTTVYPSQSIRKKGQEVVVTVEYDSRLFTPIISSIVPNPMRLRGRTVMRME